MYTASDGTSVHPHDSKGPPHVVLLYFHEDTVAVKLYTVRTSHRNFRVVQYSLELCGSKIQRPRHFSKIDAYLYTIIFYDGRYSITFGNIIIFLINI